MTYTRANEPWDRVSLLQGVVRDIYHPVAVGEVKGMLCDGNEAVGRAAIAAGCRFFFGYPITPQNEIGEFMSRELPAIGGVFLQSDGEAAASYMVFAGALAGARVMTSTSGPGFSLMQEGISHMAAAEAPAVIVNVNRLGPGSGTTQQGCTDYRQMTKGGGHGAYHCIVLSPFSAQEVFDFTQLAFYLADTYRIVVLVASDFILGRTSEPVTLRTLDFGPLPEKDWALRGAWKRGGKANQIDSGVGVLRGDIKEFFRRQLDKYALVAARETRYETYGVDGAELLLVAYGSTARSCLHVLDEGKKQGRKLGLFRPVTLWPFPEEQLRKVAVGVGEVLVVEDSPGELVEDVKAAVQGKVPVHLLNILGRDIGGPMGLIYPERILEEALGLCLNKTAAPRK